MSRDCQRIATSFVGMAEHDFRHARDLACNSGHERGVAIRKETTSSRPDADLGERIPRAICDLECGAGDELCCCGAEAGSAWRRSAAVAAGEPQDDEGRAAGVSPGGRDADGGWSVLAG